VNISVYINSPGPKLYNRKAKGERKKKVKSKISPSWSRSAKIQQIQ